jgi:hypothetical protein
MGNYHLCRCWGAVEEAAFGKKALKDEGNKAGERKYHQGNLRGIALEALLARYQSINPINHIFMLFISACVVHTCIGWPRPSSDLL